MPHCHAYKSDLLRCNAHVHAEGGFCGTHTATHARRIQRSGVRPVGTCEAYLTTHRWCGHAVVLGDRLCEHHVVVRQRSEERQLAAGVDRAMLTELLNTFPLLTWADVMDRMFADETRPIGRRRHIAQRFFNIRANVVPEAFDDRWDWLMEGRVGEEPLGVPFILPHWAPQLAQIQPVVVGDLQRLATDNQNVHTNAVTKQTNDGLKKLLAVAVPNAQDTQRIITEEWFKLRGVSFNRYLGVINDVHKWFNTPTCRTHNDKLYYNALRGLVAMLNKKTGELRTELFQRLWEECSEAVGMCCDGHITRLCNVLVGFDDDFKPPVPFGELLQNKMAAIAMLEADEEEKRRQATAFFEEFAVPQVERVAWLEAF